jgi:hypothetical protein
VTEKISIYAAVDLTRNEMFRDQLQQVNEAKLRLLGNSKKCKKGDSKEEEKNKQMVNMKI